MGRLSLEAGRYYRMPVHFGATPGPRQGPDGRAFDWASQPRRTWVVARYLSESLALERLMPPGFEVDGLPIVTVELQYLSQLPWLAGRGYNTLGVKFPARYRGRQRDWTGHFLAVIWENMPDAIISGREELGYNKIYADIPPPRIDGGSVHCGAGWYGHPFFELTLTGLVDRAVDAAPRVPGDGVMHYKYVPRTGEPGRSDAAYATLTPASGGNTRLIDVKSAQARVRFLPTTWAQAPTMFHIIGALAALPVVEDRGAFLIESIGSKDLSDQTIIE